MGNNVVIKCKNKASGVVYIYYGTSNYSKDGKCTTKGARKLIGKYNLQDEFEPNKTFLLMTPEEQLATGLVEEAYYPLENRSKVEDSDYVDKYYGYAAVIETAARKTGLYNALKKVFPNNYLSLMSMMEQLMCVPNRPLYSPDRFHNTYWHTNIDALSENDITKALEVVTPTQRERFFHEFNNERKKEGEIIVALDTTSISTYSSMLELAKYGYNKEGDDLQQINLLLVCDNNTGIPIHYRSVAGNNADCTSVMASIENMKKEDVKKGAVFVMDRGFCIDAVMVLLLKNGYSFLMCVPQTCSFYADAIEAVITNIEQSSNYIPEIGRYCATYDVKIECPRKGRGENAYTMTVYVYKDLQAEADQKERLANKLHEMFKKLNENPSLYKPNSNYKKYFTKNEDGTFSHNKESQERAMKECGLFLLIGPKEMGKIKAHYTYKNRDCIEKDYEGWKVRMRRPRHSLEEHLEGKIFLLFMVTVIETYIRNILKKAYLTNNKSLEDNIDVIFNARWRKPEGKKFKEGSWIDLTLDQMKMLHLLGVPGMDRLNPTIENLVQNDILHRQGKKAKRGRKTKKN